MQRGAVELVGDSEGGPIGHQRQHALVLGRGGGVVQGGAAKLVSSVDVAAQAHHQVHTLYVAVGGRRVVLVCT